MLHRTLLLLLIAAAVGGFAKNSDSANAHTGNHPFWLFSDRWYQEVSDSGSYVTWMTLSYDKHFSCTGCSSKWGPHVSAAIGDWNSSATTVYYSFVASHSPSLDVHAVVLNDSAYLWAGLSEAYDEDYNLCLNHDCPANQSRPNTWWYQFAYGNDYYFPSNNSLLQGVMAHELGHGLSQDHQPIPRDGIIEPSIMDYDFLDAWAGSGGYTVQPAYDECGVNHAYYDPNWGYAGCS